MSLTSKLKGVVPANQPRRTPLWEGPCGQGPNGGISFSLLSRFLVCRERFRLLTIEGLAPPRTWNHRTGYGDLWHVCEEALAAELGWELSLKAYCQDLCRKHPLQQAEIVKWYEVCRRQFPVYVEHWAKHPDVTNRTPLLQEQVFDVPYQLPSGRVVRLRGKWDSVDLVKDKKTTAVWSQENKTKGDIDEQQLQRQLKFDLQTLLYLVALYQYNWTGETKSTTIAKKPFPVKGVRYNVVRRPFSGGRGNIKQHKPTKSNPKGETEQQLYDRLLNEYIKVEPGYWFMRWQVEVTPADVGVFKREFLDPCLEYLCCWYEYATVRMAGSKLSYIAVPADALHWRHPFGIYNVLDEGGSTEYDSYLETGNRTGLESVDRLFTELQ